MKISGRVPCVSSALLRVCWQGRKTISRILIRANSNFGWKKSVKCAKMTFKPMEARVPEAAWTILDSRLVPPSNGAKVPLKNQYPSLLAIRANGGLPSNVSLKKRKRMMTLLWKYSKSILKHCRQSWLKLKNIKASAKSRCQSWKNLQLNYGSLTLIWRINWKFSRRNLKPKWKNQKRSTMTYIKSF